MLKNNNQAVIRKMAVRSIRSNRKKNSLYLVAIVLAVLMLFTVMQTGLPTCICSMSGGCILWGNSMMEF